MTLHPLLYAAAVTVAGPTFASDLQAFVSSSAVKFNTSVSVALKYRGARVVAAAEGFDSIVDGTTVDTHSLYPSGSLAKPFTAVGVLQLVERGLLHYDQTAVSVIDPWLDQQGLAPLRTLFVNSSAAVMERVTIRQLLGMRSGLPDYDDEGLEHWQFAHPQEDKPPLSYIRDVGRLPFHFAPDAGCEYSSNGFVVLGLVLAAGHGAANWQALDQLAAVATAPPLRDVIFMGEGPCSAHPGVVHQYAPTAQARARARVMARAPAPAPARAQGMKYVGDVLAVFRAATPEACCTDASNVSARGRSYAQVWAHEDDTCTVSANVHGGDASPNATSGMVKSGPAPSFLPSDALDMWSMSCLNGWSMGNIAASPAAAVDFWDRLFGGQLLNQSTLVAMQAFAPFTQGFAAGQGEYGLGLLRQPMSFPTLGACPPPLCVCDATGACMSNATLVGHPGVDWGSGMPISGHLPDFNATVGVAINALLGMNTSMNLRQSNAFMEAIECGVLDLLYRRQYPGFAGLLCDPTSS